MKANDMDIGLFKRWLENKGTLAESTIMVYTGSVGRFLAGSPDIENIEDYNSFLIKVAIKKRCSHYYSALKAFIEFKIEDANTRSKIIENMIRPKERLDIMRERRYLKKGKILQVINNLEREKHRIVSLIQLLTGVRAGEILKLKQGSIMPEEYNERPTLKIIITGKRQKRNVIFIHDSLAQKIIWNYITSYKPRIEGYYFLELGKLKNRVGNIENENKLVIMNYHWFWEDLKQALNTVGVDKDDWATHDFRRCFARRVWDKYKDIHVLQGLLHHSDPKTTLRYLEHSGLKNVDYHFEMQT